ncbi:MAG: TIGR02253 family HAD-type hydrolase [Methanobacteriaceae archaeon]
MTKSVFFDIDDTLLDTSAFAELARRAAINEMVENGLPLCEDEAYAQLKDIIAEKGSNYDKHFNILTKRVLGYEDYYLIALGMVTYHNVKFSLLRPFPRTSEVLIYLKSKKYKLNVISNGITIKQWEKLVRLNLQYFFNRVITSEEIGFEKPDVRIFEAALERTNCDAEESVMVGNKFDVDTLGAVNAGMSAILVNSGVSQSEEEEMRKQIEDEGLDIKIINNIGDLKNLL